MEFHHWNHFWRLFFSSSKANNAYFETYYVNCMTNVIFKMKIMRKKNTHIWCPYEEWEYCHVHFVCVSIKSDFVCVIFCCLILIHFFPRFDSILMCSKDRSMTLTSHFTKSYLRLLVVCAFLNVNFDFLFIHLLYMKSPIMTD